MKCPSIANGACGAPKNVVFFSNEVLRKPKLNPDRKSITIRARKIYKNEVEYVNYLLMDEVQEGIAFRDKDRVVLPM